jgi:hypothetical protein
MTMKCLHLPLIFGAVLLLAASAKGDLVSNGGFESGDFTGWALSGNTTNFYVGSSPIIERTGNDCAELGAIGSDGTLTQNITTISGHSYTLTFYFNGLNGLSTIAGPNNDFSAKFGSNTFLSETNYTAPNGWTKYTDTITATGTSTAIVFAARQDSNYVAIDDVSVVDNGVSSLPEPGDFVALAGIFATGLLIWLVPSIRRKKGSPGVTCC